MTDNPGITHYFGDDCQPPHHQNGWLVATAYHERIEKLEAMLRKYQWQADYCSPGSEWMGEFCPECQGVSPYSYESFEQDYLRNRGESYWGPDQISGHKPDCELAALLGDGSEPLKA